MTNNLTLQQMEKLGISKWMNEKERNKAVEKALEEQSNHLENSNEVDTPKKPTLEDTLRDGGLFTYTLNKKKYKLNVLTKADLVLLDNASNNAEEGIEYDVPKPFKFHVLTALDTYLTIKAQTYNEAQAVVDDVLGAGRYKVSASNL